MPITEPPQDTVADLLLPYQRHLPLCAWGMTLRSCLDFYYNRICSGVSELRAGAQRMPFMEQPAGDSGPAAAVPAPVPGLGRGPGAVQRARGHPSRRNGHGQDPAGEYASRLQQVLGYIRTWVVQIDGSDPQYHVSLPQFLGRWTRL